MITRTASTHTHTHMYILSEAAFMQASDVCARKQHMFQSSNKEDEEEKEVEMQNTRLKTKK